MSADFTERKIASRTPFRGRLLTIHEDEVRLPDGKTSTREYIEHPGAALILPMFDDGSVVLERQYRYPVGMHCYELPAGKLESGEPPLETAKRELLEETGYVAGRWEKLGSIYPCVGYSSERIDFFLARELSFQGAMPDEGEFLETLRLSVAEGLEWVRSGRINEAKTMLGLLWADRLVNGNWKGA